MALAATRENFVIMPIPAVAMEIRCMYIVVIIIYVFGIRKLNLLIFCYLIYNVSIQIYFGRIRRDDYFLL